jgi:hypothetical protein
VRHVRHASWVARAGLAVALALPAAASAACPPEGMDREGLQAFKARRFETADPAQRQRLALALAGCLGDPDPAVRDGIAYQALAQWMRAGELDVATLRALRDRLHALVDGGEGEGFARPFAALVLSEVARTDRIAPWMTPGERKAMVRKAAGYVATVQDYRGFDDARGWRHGVAHGADWLLQLALHPALERDQGDLVLEAVAAQAVPGTAHAYVFGEPARLARPVLALARSRLYDRGDWQAWFADLPPRLGDPGLAYADEEWLARRHDLVAFVLALYVGADRDPVLGELKPLLVETLGAVP